MVKYGDKNYAFQNSRSTTEPTFKALRLLKFQDIVKLQTLKFVFLCRKNLSQPIFHDYYTPLKNIHMYDTRQVSNRDIYVSKVKTECYGKMTIKYNGTIWWNSLPIDIKLANTIYSFETKLKEYILNMYNNE